SSLAILAQINKGSSACVKKVLDSAVSNAKQKGLSEDQLFIKTITACHGGAWKRYRPASFGRATPILRRTTHLTVELDIKTK
ncbi:MAG: 50S ribosomal protein L22, partial [Candidatus Omnitrophica bacterium]|nr:50S ribosomal protein L22 [Candidatus Omnitrophota bacterium]